MGNRWADHEAKDLCREVAAADARSSVQAEHDTAQWGVLLHVGAVVALCFRHWPVATRAVKIRTFDEFDGNSGKCGDHNVIKRPRGGWYCTACLREAWNKKGLRRLKRRRCDGHAGHQAHPLHALQSSRGYLWCNRCGAHTTRTPSTLVDPCLNGPRSQAYRNVLHRLRKGLLPTAAHDRKAEVSGELQPRPWEDNEPRYRVENGRACASKRMQEHVGDDIWPKRHRSIALPSTHGAATEGTSSLNVQAQRAVSGGKRKCSERSSVTTAGRRTRRRATDRSGGYGSNAGDDGGEADLQNAVLRNEGGNVSNESTANGRGHGARETSTTRRRLREDAVLELSRERAMMPAPADPPELQRAMCSRLTERPWSSRLMVIATAKASPCTGCGTPAKGKCRGCHRALCVPCARARRQCP